MGHNKLSITPLSCLVYRFIALSFAVIACALSPLAQPSASAQSHISKVSIDNLVGNNTTTLDWKTNEVVIPFDLPDTVWVDQVEFLVSAQPTGQLRQRRNLQLRVNGSKPIILKAQGQRFDARVRLETKHLRRRGNKLHLSGIATSPNCPGPNSAGWEISQDRSILVFYGRNMTRDLNFRDLDTLLSQSFNGPALNLGLKVIGEESFRHESLIMQAMTLRTGAVPKLNKVAAENKLNIIAGLRGDVQPFIRGEAAGTGRGAEIILDEKRPPRLIITGDTTEELRKSVDAFAAHKLPVTRRTRTTANEVRLQPFLSSRRSEFNGSHKLSEAGVLLPINSWLTPAQSFSFDTSYAAQRQGQLLLRLNGNERIAADSTVSVTLNGRKLGETQIDAVRKSVRFDIPEGYLIGSNNQLKIQPDLKPATSLDICSVAQTPPSFSFGMGSKVILSGAVNKDMNDISSLAADSGPFATSDNFIIYGTARNHHEKQASLRLIGGLAHISGRAWTQAQYINGQNALIPQNGNLLIVGPNIKAMDGLLVNAPKALRLALNGKNIPEFEDQKIASILQVASLSEKQAFELAATSARQDALNYTSGLIALYDDAASRRTIGVITARSGASFKTAALNLLKPSIWNMLQGSVAKWDDETAVMLQTAQPQNLSQNQTATRLQNFIDFKFEGFGKLEGDWLESLRAKRQSSGDDFKRKTAHISEQIGERLSAVFSPKPSLEPDLNRVEEAKSPRDRLRPSTPIAKPKNSIPIPRLKTPNITTQEADTKKSLGLRGAYDPQSFKETKPAKPRDIINLNALNSPLSKGVETIKSKSVKAYNDFEKWGETLNANSKNGLGSINISAPIIALLGLIFTLLILLSIAVPHQRHD